MSPAKPSASKKLFLVSVFFLLFALSAGGAAVAAARLIFSPARVRALSVHHLSRRLGREVSVGGARISWRGGLIMKDVKIFEKRGGAKKRREIFSCEAAEARAGIKDIFRGKRTIAALKITSPVLYADASGGAFDIPDFGRAFEVSRYRYTGKGAGAVAPGGGDRPPIVIAVARVEIKNGTINVERRGEAAFKISELSVAADPGAAGGPSISAGFVFSNDSLSARVRMEGRLDVKNEILDVAVVRAEMKGAELAGSGYVKNYASAAKLNYGFKFRAGAEDLEKISGDDAAKFLRMLGKGVDIGIDGTLLKTRVSAVVEGVNITINF